MTRAVSPIARGRFHASNRGVARLVTVTLPLAAFLLLLGILVPPTAAAGARIDFTDGRSLEVLFALQFWNATTIDAAGPDGAAIADRSDFYVRRGRFGIKGAARERVSFLFWFAYDNISKDPFSSSTGSPQDDSNKEFYLWDAIITVALDPTWANLTLGYFRPQVGRESITSAFAVDSFTKALANSYPRRHVVGRGTGREAGLNLGGLYHSGQRGLNYNVGVFDPGHAAIAGGGGETSLNWAPLWTGRIALTLGDAEHQRYGLGYKVNYFGKRSGITFACNGTYQDKTNETAIPNDPPEPEYRYAGGFDSNAMIGWDLLFNHGPFSLSAEYDLLVRRFSREFGAIDHGLPCEYRDRVWHVRAGYNLTLCSGQVIEPVLMFSRYDADRESAFWPGSEHTVIAGGLNWYIDGNRWKVNLFYNAQDWKMRPRYGSDHGDKGDFLGAGMQVVF